MAITIDATAGGASANSYVTLADAETYYESRLHSDDWDDAEDSVKNEALAMATAILDSELLWVCSPTSTTQALRWPRTRVLTPEGIAVDTDTIPKFLEDATAEFSLWLIKDDRLSEPDTQGFTQIKVGSILATINPRDRRGLIPPIVKTMVSFYGEFVASGIRTLERV